MPTKTFWERLDPRTHRRLPPWVCILINQAAFPGLGTIMAGRRGGFVQAGVMVAGFCLALAFFVWFLVCSVRYVMSSSWDEGEWRAHYAAGFWMLRGGLGLCAVAWLWSLFSSIGILREKAGLGK